MSVEATALERSKLEQKDRSELSAIVEAMGGKATSRAKKADLVDQVLRLAGLATDDAGGNTQLSLERPARNGGRSPSAVAEQARDTAASSVDQTDARAPAAPEVETEVADVAAPDGEAAPATSRATSSSPASTTQTSSTQASSTQADVVGPGEAAGDGNREQPEPRGEGQPQEDRARDRDRDRDRSRDRDRDRQGGQRFQPGQGGQGGAQQQGQQGQRGDDGEAGNRRRRRRGRDRDRNREPVAEETVYTGEPVEVEGYLDLRDEGYGFLRLKGYLPSKDDVYVSVKQVRQFGLRKGDYIKGGSRPASRNEKNPALLRIDSVNEADPELARTRRRFEDLTPLFPDEKLRMEVADDPGNMTARIVDLISPIGKGQRGLIVSPPKAGKTTIVKQIVRAIEINDPEVKVIVLLVDERPEEVTDMRRWLLHGECAASTFDRPSDEHTQVAELTLERAKRMVEQGKDVVIILDGITRLARAYNLAAPATGRIMSGGVDSGALYPPKKFFGAARNIEEGGSLTILATALVETGSKMDEVIFEEFKGTGNMELRLDRKLAERRIYPAIDVDASSTRHEELLFPRIQLQMVWKLRRVLSGLSGGEGGGNSGAGLELMIDRLKTFKSNDEFLAEIAKAPSISG